MIVENTDISVGEGLSRKWQDEEGRTHIHRKKNVNRRKEGKKETDRRVGARVYSEE